MKKAEFELLKKVDGAYSLAASEYTKMIDTFTRKAVETKADYEARIDSLLRQLAELKEQKKAALEAIETNRNKIENDREDFCQKRLQAIEDFLKKHFISNDMMEQLLEAETGKGWVISQTTGAKTHYNDFAHNRTYRKYTVDLFIASADSKMYNQLKDANIPNPFSHLSKVVVHGFNHEYLRQLEQKGMTEHIVHKEYHDYKRDDRYDKMNWMEIYLTEKGICGKPVSNGFLNNPKLIGLIVRAIDNQYFNENEEEKAQD
ncbi:MAG: hypothetical protein J6A28_01495 [Clostridia bacterium]|nr:hypothetical protein [Clostridia bacterium]